jgi:peptidoglycan/LPS O-acetylase OafA/YrhL
VKFDVLDSFRGLCALFVVLFHIRVQGTISEVDFIRQSYYFVEFFFVLSGFVIAHSCRQSKTFYLRQFLIRRIFRIFPLHLFMLCGFLVYESLKYQAHLGGYVFEKVLFLSPDLFKIIIHNISLTMSWLNIGSINTPAWSISIEIGMYIFLGLLLSILIYHKSFILVISTIFIIAVLALLNGTGSGYHGLYRGLSCFFGGVLTYQIFVRCAAKIQSQKKRGIFTVFEFSSLMTVLILISLDFKYKYTASVFLFSIVIFIFSFEKGLLSNFFKQNLFSFLGKHSYSIYLSHFLILNFFVSIITLIPDTKKYTYIGNDNWRMIDFQNMVLNNLYLVIVLFAVIFFSKYSYKYIEAPFNNFGRRISGKNSKLPCHN